MPTNNYTAGTSIRTTFAVTNLSGAPIDPGSVSAKLMDPTGAVVDVSGAIVRDGEGAYHADVVPELTGLYQYEWLGTGDATVAAVGSFIVNQDQF